MADRFKNLAKNGWHPEKSAASSSSSSGGQSESKLGQVKGWVGKAQGKDTHAAAALEHQATPLSSLKDPSSFAPPPKRVNYTAGPVAPSSTRTPTTAAAPPPTNSTARPAPRPPPRLPPRQNSNPDAYAPPPPPTYNEATQQGTPSQGVLNQGALGRLGQAGVSVPGFGIGRTASPPVPARQMASPPVPFRESSAAKAPTPPPASAGHGSQMNELQNRFAKMSTPASGTAAAPSAGTSWADKQATLRTAANLRDDPSKVSASDLRGAASTANNFQQRHGEQVSSGWKAASGLNQKYGIAGRVNQFASSSSTAPAAPQSPTQSSVPGGSMIAGGKKKPPPPPPPKKKELSAGEPPPIPLGSKPKF
ncbi:uncharacterized protein K460DRAFT_369097 [Cucurbitaria berberidis CBS 394.84]|uniref:GMP synthase n=1 Tax=Cucurbitaria berberidis CBS 394.84 TaxID=1168544 RepID=A0A9P4GES3_9PLEO|nr:uncharacterized protein K460DRAFT_369097 [Cucurbitaria berberidis CBS 394.84]KAF1844230.1 hypothetical protein K460DRAFT_369097 [Cucurbitaria berberidis CBS 394.84]